MRLIDLIIYRSVAELKSEGTRTYAGYLWWILEPLMSLAVYYVAFKYIFHRDTENFALFLFSGIVIYRFFSGSVMRAASSISSNKGLMQLVYIHKTVFPLSAVSVNLVKFLVTLLLVVIVASFVGIVPSLAYITLPILIILQSLLTAGVSMICAAITVFFPDFQLILGTLLHLLIFLSGVFYDVKKLSPNMQNLIRLNPVAVIIEQIRSVILYGQWPQMGALLLMAGIAILCLMIGGFLINKYDRDFPKLS